MDTPSGLTATFRVDVGAGTFLICCRDCGWRDLHPSRTAAWSAATSHARIAHPDQVTATQANLRGHTYRKRHAPGTN